MNLIKYATNGGYRRQWRIDKAYNAITKAVAENRQAHIEDQRRRRPTTLPTEVHVGRFTKINIPQRSDLANNIFLNQYFFDDLDKAYQGELYFKYAIDRYIESVLRNGYSITSKNPLVGRYLEKRFKEFELSSGTTMQEFMRDLISMFLMYGNVFLVKYRNRKISSGKAWKRYDGKEIPPIASLFVEDSRKIHIAVTGASRYIYVRVPEVTTGRTPNTLNTFLMPFGLSPFPSYTGYPKTWSQPQMSSEVQTAISSGRSGKVGNFRIYKDLDISHVRYHHVPGQKWSMPPFWPTIHDIDTLRRIEENIELLMYQYGHPLLHGKVGDKDKHGSPAEVKALKTELANMEGNGFIATDEKVGLDYVGAEGKAIRAEEYLRYFKQRVFTGLWLSTITVGEGDVNRATAETVDMTRQDKTIELQHMIAAELQPILIELLLEGGVDYNWALKPENIPAIHFPEVDLNKKIALESHVLNMYNSNIITETEARVMLGFDPLEESERSGLFVYSVSAVAGLLKLGLEPVAKFAMERIGGANNSTKMIVKPTNQSGQKQSPSTPKNPKSANR